MNELKEMIVRITDVAEDGHLEGGYLIRMDVLVGDSVLEERTLSPGRAATIFGTKSLEAALKLYIAILEAKKKTANKIIEKLKEREEK